MTYPGALKPSVYNSDQNVHGYSAYVTFGAAAITTAYGKGFTLARTGVGVFSVTLQQPYNRFTKLPRFDWSKAAGTAVLSTVTTVISTLGTTGVFEVKTVTAAGVATEPTDGDIATLTFEVTQDPENNATSVL